ncbi:hypothetical protein L604_000700000890 [Bacillus subtilis J27]|nr:hypothetical protein [Bacillus subtilis]TWG74394.1 hypothetical protein L604_000700000890 [Bacillus subtilis J27]
MKNDEIVIEIVESEHFLEIITEQEQQAEKAYEGMIKNLLAGRWK